jgi:ankyrin repeat protein
MTLEKKKTTATPKRVASYAPEDTIDTRLIKACFEGNNTLAQEILENNKIDINGNESPNALGWALLTANEPLAGYLVAKGADPNHPNAVSNTLEEIICEATEPGSFNNAILKLQI